MPCKNKLDASNLSCIFYVVWGFLGRIILNYEHVTTTVIKILLTTLCKIDHNYSGRNVHPQSHICQNMSSVGKVLWTRSHNISLRQLQSHYATMIQNIKIAITWSSTPISPCVLIVHNIYTQIWIWYHWWVRSMEKKNPMHEHKLAKNINEMVATKNWPLKTRSEVYVPAQTLPMKTWQRHT
jgi:hypothetical protein